MNVENIANEITDWAGKDARYIKNSSDDTVIISQDGTRKVKFDFNKNFSPENFKVIVKYNNLLYLN